MQIAQRGKKDLCVGVAAPDLGDIVEYLCTRTVTCAQSHLTHISADACQSVCQSVSQPDHITHHLLVTISTTGQPLLAPPVDIAVPATAASPA